MARASTSSTRKRISKRPASRPEETAGPQLPFDRSVGYQIRQTHRLVQKLLQLKIERFGVSLGMWWLLRVLWEEDGLTQRELSERVGTMEPTTLAAITAMEERGIVSRVRNTVDKRKINVFLTPHGYALKATLLPVGIDVVNTTKRGLSPREVDLLLGLLSQVRQNLAQEIQKVVEKPEIQADPAKAGDAEG